MVKKAKPTIKRDIATCPPRQGTAGSLLAAAGAAGAKSSVAVNGWPQVTQKWSAALAGALQWGQGKDVTPEAAMG